VVTGTREPSEALRVPAHVTVLTAEQLSRSTWRDVAEALAVQPGLFARRNGMTAQDIDLDARGFNNGGGNGQRLLVLVDGRKTNRVTGSNTDWAAIPLENIERIEVVRGPSASLYGDTAVAGVVHIITREGAEAAVRNLSAGGGSFGTFRERLFVSGKEDDLTYAVFAKGERSDGFRENSAYEGKDYTVKLGYALDADWRLSFKAGVHDDTRERPGTLTQGEAALHGRDASLTPGDENSVFVSNGDAGIERRRSRFMKGAGDVDERTSVFTSWTHGRGDSLITFVGGGTTALKDDSNLIGLTLQHTALLRVLDPDAADVKVTVGADLGYESADAASFNNFPPFFVQDQDTGYRRRLLGLFARDEWAATDALLVSGGLRFDRALFGFDQQTQDLVAGTVTDADGGKAFDQWNPHVGVTYRWGASTSTYLSWGRTMRYPNRDELLGFLTASPELRPERAATWEAGIREEWGRSFTGTLSVYRMDVQDEIFFVPPPAGAFAFGANRNVTRIRHQGIESGFRWQALDTLALTGSHAFARTTMETGAFDRHQLPLTPRNQGAFGAEWEVLKGLLVTTQTRIVGPRFLLNDLDNTTRGLPSYAVTDIGLKYRRGAFQAWITAYNAGDREYYDNGGIGGFPHGSREAFNPAPGAHYELGAQVEF
jgi:iron complex outermembrane receptor protein